MIIHFIPYEKFVDRTISLFEEVFPDENCFYIFRESNTRNIPHANFVKSKKNNINIIDEDTKWWRHGYLRVSDNDQLFFHNLYSPANIYFINRFKSNPNKHAAIWGHDFYGENKFWSLPKFGELTLELKTSQVLLNPSKSIDKLYYYLNRLIDVYFNKKKSILKPTLKTKSNAFKNINTIQTHVKEDFFNVKKQFDKEYKWSNFSYYTYEDYDINSEVELNENRIQVGNSATFSNNHLEVFLLLEQFQVKAEIFCPLNYGDENYAKCIEDKGNSIFGSNFKALLEFLPLQDYNKLQASCGIVIMNHYRQQAAGNIICALLYGSKVFMSINSPLYKHFKSLGVSIFSLEEDLKSKKDLKLLTNQEIKKNKDILRSYYSRQNIINALKASIAI